MTFRWPFRMTLPVQFRDLDAMGHVNNAVYLAWLEQARNTCYLEMLGRHDPLEKGRGLDFVVARAEVDYLAPLHFGDQALISLWPVKIGRSSFVLDYDCRRQDDVPFLKARTVLVAYDWESARSKPLSGELQAALEAGMGTGPWGIA